MSEPPLSPPCPSPAALRSGRRVLLGLILLCLAIELVLQGADHGLWGNPRWRTLSYENGGFWAGLLHDWQPNFRLQPLTMFFSYALLHAGFSHALGNMMGLAFLGDIAAQRYGARGLLVLYAAATLGGGLAFGLLSTSPAPMIGASGAIFGLAGAWTIWAAQARQSLFYALAITAGLAALNAVIWAMQGGNLAWQTHLGGFATGAILALYPRGFLTPALVKTRS